MPQLKSIRLSNFKIKFRLVTAGVILSVLTLAGPMAVRQYLVAVNRSLVHHERHWKTLVLLAQVQSDIYDFQELELTESNAKERNENQKELESSIFFSLGELQKWASGDELYATKVEFLKKSVANYFQSHSKVLALEALRALAETQQEAEADINLLRKSTLNRNKAAYQVTTYASIVLFVVFSLLMLSIWNTLMPDLSELLKATGEFMKGNLAYRVRVSGKTETAELGRAFNEMAVSIKKQNKKLEELNKIKTDFVSTVSHELRTPLTAIKGSIGLILGGVTGAIPDETQDLLVTAQKNTDRLVRLINEILDVSKIEAGAMQLHLNKYSVGEILEHATQVYLPMAKEKKIELEYQAPSENPVVIVDRDRIEQVVTNLISNALKFTEAGGKVCVRCSTEQDQVLIHVQDTGQGIPEEFLSMIFEKFQQAERVSLKAKEGTGLGLAIAKALVEEHGGRIWVRSQPGAGSEFVFTLPWNSKEVVEVPQSSETTRASKAA